jgi:type VI secretion system protein ImpA
VSVSDLSADVKAGSGAAPISPADSSELPQLDTPAAPGPAPPPDPAVAALCIPMSEADPCGPDLDSNGDSEFLDYFAATEGILPTSFFSAEDGKPFDRSTVDLPGQIEKLKPLMARTRDLRLLITRARLFILNRDLAGFAVSLAAVAEWLDKFWDAVHPRPEGDDPAARVAALRALDFPTVVFPLQYTPLFEVRRIGPVTYRACIIAAGEAKPRTGEQKHPATALTDALAEAEPAVLAATRRHVAILMGSLGRIHNAFLMRGSSCGLENLPQLVGRISAYVDPLAPARQQDKPQTGADDVGTEMSKKDGADAHTAGGAPASLYQAKAALNAIAEYYARLEPSSPTLPLVRQAHQLIGKSFIEVMNILVPTQIEKAAFQIGAEQVFELPVARLSKISEPAPEAPKPLPVDGVCQSEAGDSPSYNVQSRSQAVALLEQVQRFFRTAEPSSPVPMLCDRARALAERDFMGVLRDVLPKAALKNAGADK